VLLLWRVPRERDKIRSWLAMPETKAFIPELEAARRQIEVEMERFKQCGAGHMPNHTIP